MRITASKKPNAHTL